MGSVMAVHIQAGIGFGQSGLSGEIQGSREILAILGHTGEDEVGSAVDYALERDDAVASQAVGQSTDKGNAGANAGFPGDDPASLAGLGEQGFAAIGEEGLVRGDHMLAGGQGFFDYRTGRRDAADQFQDYVHRRIGEGTVQVGM